MAKEKLKIPGVSIDYRESELSVWYKNNDQNDRAVIRFGVYNGRFTINMNIDLVTDSKNIDKYANATLALSEAHFNFQFFKDNFLSLESNQLIKIPIVRRQKSDTGEYTGPFTKYGDLVLGRDDKEYFFSFVLPGRKNRKFSLTPLLNTEEWKIAKADNVVDTLSISRSYTTAWLDRIIASITNSVQETEKIAHKFFVARRADKQQESNTSTNTTSASNTPKEEPAPSTTPSIEVSEGELFGF